MLIVFIKQMFLNLPIITPIITTKRGIEVSGSN